MTIVQGTFLGLKGPFALSVMRELVPIYRNLAYNNFGFQLLESLVQCIIITLSTRFFDQGGYRKTTRSRTLDRSILEDEAPRCSRLRWRSNSRRSSSRHCCRRRSHSA